MRRAAVAGAFYTNNVKELEQQVDSFLNKVESIVEIREDARAIVCPHAGFVYSGFTAAHSFAAARKVLEKKNTTVILVGPNHTGLGEMISVSAQNWSTPLGEIGVDLEVSKAFVDSSPFIQRDELAHLQEHSLEVQLPFLQRINSKIRIVCICMMDQSIDASREVGKRIFEIVNDLRFEDRNFVVLASSDFTHMESGEIAKKLDSGPIKSIEKMDDEKLQDEVVSKAISICGHGPIAAIIEYCRLSGVKNSKLLKYTNSGIETGTDEKQVVAYASFVFYGG
jgi:AmmeMemoRadiSam system protein B